MKKCILLLLVFFFFKVNAQQIKNKSSNRRFTATEKYFSFNPFALAEPQIAIGAGFGNRFSERSEYFTELSYIAKHPFYEMQEKSLHGFRFLAQYRYHFLQKWKPLINLGLMNRQRRASQNPFIGFEFRLKYFNFSGTTTFVRSLPPDTLSNFLYKANAVSIGGAVLSGSTFDLSRNGKWKFEFTIGIGAKNKIVKFKNISGSYFSYRILPKDGPVIPLIYEEAGSPYIPCTLRLRYVIR
jgi:hypothetical protein